MLDSKLLKSKLLPPTLGSALSNAGNYARGLFGLWLICVFSLFIPIQIYVPLFALFILGVVIYALSVAHQKGLTKRYVGFFIVASCFVIMASFIYITRRDFSDLEQYIKLILNINFLVATIFFFELRKHFTQSMMQMFTALLQVVIWLSALQVLRNVAFLGAWFWPLGGAVSSSDAAYLIVYPGVFFGSPEKNIWATKIALFVCLYAVIVWQQKRIFQAVPLLTLALGVFGVLYTFSRTAQLSLAVLFILMGYLYAYQRKLWFFRHLLVGGFLLLLPLFFFVLSQLLRVDASLFDISRGHQGDGFRARILLWVALWQQREYVNFLLGNGILYGKYFFTHVVELPNNNFHNVFLNTLIDTGLSGLLLYISMFTCIFAFRKPFYLIAFLLFPLLAILNLQYLGYDNDVVVYLAGCWLIFRAQQQNLSPNL